jgi:two-component system, LytTR family, response regulator
MLRAIIIDDEQSGIEMLKTLAGRTAGKMRIVASSQQAEEGIALIEDYRPDVVFLDISMPAMNGFELLSRLEYQDFKLVFSTAHRDYAIDAIRSRAFDYLLKPVDQNDFSKCVDNLLAESEKQQRPVKREKQVFVELVSRDGIHYLRPDDIIRLKASRSYTTVHLANGERHVASRPLKEFEEKLDPAQFFRCHHSHIVNLHRVRKFVNHQGYFALMDDGALVDVSKKSKDVFVERLKYL